MASGAMEMDRSRHRRDRTFIGSECAVCEEPLEHTLRGERVLQFCCTHVSHEACFYEYIREIDSQHCPTCDAPLGLDTSRGGNVLDIEKLSNIVRSASVIDSRDSREHLHPSSSSQGWETQSATQKWDNNSLQNASHSSSRNGSVHGANRDSRDSRESRPDLRDSSATRLENGHWRSPSGTSAGEFPETPSTRRHDFDVHNMESSLSPREAGLNAFQPPQVTVRSEFPTLTRSKTQQALTCLVTVEVADRKWSNSAEEGHLPPIPGRGPEEGQRPPSPAPSQVSYTYQSSSRAAELEQITEDLRYRVENWHSLDVSRFGKLRLHGTIKVGKDCQSWQELECFLFSEMLICVKEKRASSASSAQTGSTSKKRGGKCTLKGSILIKKHLKRVSDSSSADDHILTLNLSVAELPSFHLQFPNHSQLEQWRRALLDLNSTTESSSIRQTYEEKGVSDGDEDDNQTLSDGRYLSKSSRRVSSANSSYGGSRSGVTAPTEYTNSVRGTRQVSVGGIHVPIDMVVVIPVSSSMQGLKINLLRDSLKFLVQNLGEKDRMGLVTFGSSGGGVPLVGMTKKLWSNWSKVINSIRPVGQKSLRADVVEGANVAMDLLMQRKSNNAISTILLISDSSTSDVEVVDFVVSRAEAAKVAIHSFGLGLTHKPDTMIELSTRTKASFTYVKDWMLLRECIAGCLGSLQSLSHQNVRVKLKLPEGSPARFTKISGALQVTKKATGREAEAALGDLHFGDKKDILVQLVIDPDNSTNETPPADPWETIVSGLEALGGPIEADEHRVISIEEVPLIQADLSYGDIQRDGAVSHSSRPSLLTITMLPAGKSKQSNGRPGSPPIPPHPMIVQRRMELLTSDMLSRALTLVSRGQHERAQTLLFETRTILRGLGKGGLPPLPPPPGSDQDSENGMKPSPSSTLDGSFSPATGIDSKTVASLDSELESALEWIGHPAVFARDSRKSVLQAIGVISAQRAITFRTASESLYASRVYGVKRLITKAREWREGEESLMEED